MFIEKEPVSAESEGEPSADELEEGTATSTASDDDAEAAQAVSGTESGLEQTDEQKAADAKALEQKEKKRKRKELYTAKEDARSERSRAEQAERELQALKDASKPQGRPGRDDFESEEDYEDALIDYRLGKQRAESANQASKAEKNSKLAENRRKYNAGVADAEEKHDDFHEVAGDAGMSISSDFLADQIKSSDFAHDIVYFLGKNPEEARRLSSLSEFEQVREVGRLEARLDAEPDQNNITRTPDPGKNISGAGVGGAGGKQETTDEYIARMNQEEEARWKAEG